MKKSFTFPLREQRRVAAFLVALMATKCSAPAWAQQAVSADMPHAQSATAPARPQYERVFVTAGRSTVVSTDFEVTRIAVTNPDVADAVVVQPREVLVDGKKPGTVSLIVWSAGSRHQYDIVVEPAITPLEQRLQALFPGEAITV